MMVRLPSDGHQVSLSCEPVKHMNKSEPLHFFYAPHHPRGLPFPAGCDQRLPQCRVDRPLAGRHIFQVHLLNFERPSDVHEYRLPAMSAGGVNGGGDRAPSSLEAVKDVLRLRVEFSRDMIDALEL